MSSLAVIFSVLLISSISSGDQGECKEARANKILSSLKISQSNMSSLVYENDCDDDYFCFIGTLNGNLKIKENDLAPDTKIGFCGDKENRSEIASITLVGKSEFVVDSDISCQGRVDFDKDTQTFCQCIVSKPLKYLDHWLPAKTRIMRDDKKLIKWFEIGNETKIGKKSFKPDRYIFSSKTKQIIKSEFEDNYCSRD